MPNEERVLLEYVSANPNGPITVDHARAGIAGDILARVFAASGCDVSREYYVNDASAGAPTPDTPFARRLAEQGGAAGDAAVALHRADLARIDVRFDRFFRESELVAGGAVEAMIADLLASGHAERRGDAVWLCTSRLGDTQDRVLVRESGVPTYLAADLAYHRDKLARGYDLLVNLWNAAHEPYVARTHAGLAAMGADPERLMVAVVHPVRILQGGVERRTGRGDEPWTLEEALALAPAASLRLRLALFPLSEAAFLDLDAAADDPILARLDAARKVPLTATETDPALVFVRSKAQSLPDALAAARRDLAPNRIAEYALDLAGALNAAGRGTQAAKAALDMALRLLGLESDHAA